MNSPFGNLLAKTCLSASQSFALPQPAGQFVRFFVFKALQLNEFECFAGPTGLLGLGNLTNGQDETDVSCDTHIREKGVVLKRYTHVESKISMNVETAALKMCLTTTRQEPRRDSALCR